MKMAIVHKKSDYGLDNENAAPKQVLDWKP